MANVFLPSHSVRQRRPSPRVRGGLQPVVPLFLCLLLVLGLGLRATAQPADSLAPPPARRPALPAGAAVVLPPADTLFRVYGRVGSFSPSERAEAIERRLQVLLKDPLFSSDSLAVVDTEQDTQIMYADTHVLSVGNAEAQALGQLRPIVARQYLSILRRHLAAAQQASSLPVLLKRGALAVLTLLMLA